MTAHCGISCFLLNWYRERIKMLFLFEKFKNNIFWENISANAVVKFTFKIGTPPTLCSLRVRFIYTRINSFHVFTLLRGNFSEWNVSQNDPPLGFFTNRTLYTFIDWSLYVLQDVIAFQIGAYLRISFEEMQLIRADSRSHYHIQFCFIYMNPNFMKMSSELMLILLSLYTHCISW